MTPTSVLLVTNSQDQRESTTALRRIADALAEQPGVEVSVFILRHSWGTRTDWPGARVVDDLRTWLPAAVIERVASTSIASRLRGLRLRWWVRQAHPDVVILDDGLGFRTIEHLAPRPTCITRLNREAPVDGYYEPHVLPDPDLVVAPVDHTVEAGVPVIREHPFRDLGSAASFSDLAVRSATRRRLGLPEAEPVIAGWGGDGWLDGPDLFIRTLWALGDRHGVPAHGLWFGTDQPDEAQRLRDEAARCGLADRYHLVPYTGHGDTPPDALCADAALLPSREALLREHLMAAIVSGMIVVAFDSCDIDDPAVWTGSDLDVDAAAARLAKALDEDRPARSSAALRDVDVALWTRDLLDAASRVRR